MSSPGGEWLVVQPAGASGVAARAMPLLLLYPLARAPLPPAPLAARARPLAGGHLGDSASGKFRFVRVGLRARGLGSAVGVSLGVALGLGLGWVSVRDWPCDLGGGRQAAAAGVAAPRHQGREWAGRLTSDGASTWLGLKLG